MAISIFDRCTIGVGPSSSHTVGPMRAARRFASTLADEGTLARTARVRVELYGSLAMAGKGHGTDRAVMVGLAGETPEGVDPDRMPARIEEIRATCRLALLGRREVPFDQKRHLVFNRKDLLPVHSNGMRFNAFDAAGGMLAERIYYSVGGGFVVNEGATGEDRIVAAPTNGAAGIVPAVLHYYRRFTPGADEEGVLRFLLTAGAIGILYKENASISGAEVGCQGEVGVACSMAAGGLVAALGGTTEQIENAAEIGMEHNLGLTCDPVGGLVQIPCIERNAMGSVKAINASRIALRGDGSHKVP